MISVEYYEYECGNYCSVDGCKGHVTNIPVGVEIEGVMFYVDGYQGGDFPGEGKSITKVQKAVAYLKSLEKGV